MFQGCKSLCLTSLRPQSQLHSKCMSSLSKSEIIKRRNALFDEEKQKQKAAVGRIEKIEVEYLSPQAKAVLLMNKNLSTPYDCTRHKSETVSSVAALAMVDGQPWDMHKPLVNDCKLKILTMNTPEIVDVNVAFWRTCSLLLGCVAKSAFKDDIEVHLHSFPVPNIRSGCFTYDVHINLPDWKPTLAELLAMGALFKQTAEKQLLCERLEVSSGVASDILQDNPFKLKQIPNIANKNNNMVTLYRIGDHIDISKGPMVGNTDLIGRCSVTAVHKLKHHEDSDNMYRFQGVAVPRGIVMNHFAYGIIENRAKKFQEIRQPQSKTEEESPVKIKSYASN